MLTGEQVRRICETVSITDDSQHFRRIIHALADRMTSCKKSRELAYGARYFADCLEVMYLKEKKKGVPS